MLLHLFFLHLCLIIIIDTALKLIIIIKLQLKPNNQSAWTYSESRKEFYYSLDETPQLNFRNTKVVDEFSNVLKTFLNNGVKGVRLTGVPYLLVDENLAAEVPRSGVSPDILHTDYRFFAHTKTTNLLDLGPLVKTWRNIVKANSENGPIFLEEDLVTLEPFKVNSSYAIDLPRQSEVLTTKNISASELVRGLNATLLLLNDTWPLWKVSVLLLNVFYVDI